MNLIWLLVPVIVGATTPIVLQMAVQMAKSVGHMESAVVLHAVGALVGLAWVGLGLRGAGFTHLAEVPWWAWLGGAIGVCGMAALNRAIPEIGVATFVGLNLAAQLVIALLVDRRGWLGAEVREIGLSHGLGAVLLVMGAVLISR